jgi:hypothetical protein
MSLKVIDRHKIDITPPGKCCRKPDSDQQCSYQARAGGDRHDLGWSTRRL